MLWSLVELSWLWLTEAGLLWWLPLLLCLWSLSMVREALLERKFQRVLAALFEEV